MGDIGTQLEFATDSPRIVVGDWMGNVQAISMQSKETVDFTIPVRPSTQQVAKIDVPTPDYDGEKIEPKPTTPTVSTASSNDELARKRVVLQAIEEAVEKMKDEAARDPNNEALTKAYLQLCEALTMKADLFIAEASSLEHDQ